MFLARDILQFVMYIASMENLAHPYNYIYRVYRLYDIESTDSVIIILMYENQSLNFISILNYCNNNCENEFKNNNNNNYK